MEHVCHQRTEILVLSPQGEHMDDDEGYVDPYADDDGGDQAYM